MSVTFMVSPGTLIGGHAGMMNRESPWTMQAVTNLRARTGNGTRPAR